jgi:hypothetical protein
VHVHLSPRRCAGARERDSVAAEAGGIVCLGREHSHVPDTIPGAALR